MGGFLVPRSDLQVPASWEGHQARELSTACVSFKLHPSFERPLTSPIYLLRLAY